MPSNDRYARYDRSPKGRARKARYRATGRENTLRWMRMLRKSISDKQERIRTLEEYFNG